MSGACGPHLQRRNGIYHLRMRVPDAVRQVVGLTEVRKSLRTYAPSEARRLVGIFSARLREAFLMIVQGNLDKQQAVQIIQSCFSELAARAENERCFIPETATPEFELAEQKQLGGEHISDLQHQAHTHAYSGAVTAAVANLLSAYGVNLSSQPPGIKADLLQGVVRAMIEQERAAIVRLDDRLAPYTPVDALFAHQGSQFVYAKKAGKLEALVTYSPDAKTVGESVKAYLEAHEKRWQPRTFQARVTQLGYLVEFFGEKLITTVTPADIRAYRDTVLKLRANRGPSQKLGFWDKQTDIVADRMKPKTASLIFEPCKAFFHWAKYSESLVDANPAADIKILPDIQPKGHKSRRPFTDQELFKLFSSPGFTGHKSEYRRLQIGTVITKDARYWIPILGFYTGCRLGELVQLHLNDVHLDAAVPHLCINEDRPQGGDLKHVKSKAGIRKVPLHPDLLDLGFAEFAGKRKKLYQSQHRLFAEIPFGAHGQASGEFSKLFARYIDKIGLNDQALCFHSFRHNAEDALREALQHQYVIDRIIGHDDGATSSKYGQGVSLDVMLEAIKAMRLGCRVPAIVGGAKSFI